MSVGASDSKIPYARSSSASMCSTEGRSASVGMVWTDSPETARNHPSVAAAMCTSDDRTDDQPATGSAANCSGVSLRHASSIRSVSPAVVGEKRRNVVGHGSPIPPSGGLAWRSSSARSSSWWVLAMSAQSNHTK